VLQTAFAIAQSGLGVQQFYKDFFPKCAPEKEGWRKALPAACKMKNLQEFYFMFEMFLQMDAENHRKLLRGLTSLKA